MWNKIVKESDCKPRSRASSAVPLSAYLLSSPAVLSLYTNQPLHHQKVTDRLYHPLHVLAALLLTGLSSLRLTELSSRHRAGVGRGQWQPVIQISQSTASLWPCYRSSRRHGAYLIAQVQETDGASAVPFLPCAAVVLSPPRVSICSSAKRQIFGGLAYPFLGRCAHCWEDCRHDPSWPSSLNSVCMAGTYDLVVVATCDAALQTPLKHLILRQQPVS